MSSLASKWWRQRAVAVAVVAAWLPYASTCCLENLGCPHDAAGSVNCIFGHHGTAESHSDHHDEAAAPAHHHDAATAHEHGRQGHDPSADTCCTWTGKSAVTLSSAPVPPDPSAAVALIAQIDVPRLVAPLVDRVRGALALAHAPPLYLRHATLLI